MIVIFVALIYVVRKLYRRYGLTPSLLVVFTFLFSTVMGMLYFITNRDDVPTHSFFSMIYYAATLLIFLSPLFRNPGLHVNFSFPYQSTKIFTYFLIIGGTISFYSSIHDFSLFEMMGNWADIRSEYYNSWGESMKATSLLERVESNFSHILFICMPLAFYYFSNNQRRLGILLFIVSLTTLVQSLKDAERQDLLLWIAGIVMSYLMFKDSFKQTTVRKIRIALTILISLVVIVIGSITIARFGEDSELINSLYDYSAVQPYNAAYFLENLSDQALGGRLNFPIFFGGHIVLEINDYINSDVFLNSFSSIVGSYYKDFGYFTIFIALLVASIFDKLMSISRAKHSFIYFFLYCLYFNIMFVGVFYNKYTSPPMYRIVVFSILLIVIIELIFKSKKRYGCINYNDAL